MHHAPRAAGRASTPATAARKWAWKKAATKRVTKPGLGDETGDETPMYRLANEQLVTALTKAARGNIDAFADLEPIRELFRQGCDLEADLCPPWPPSCPSCRGR
jgi:hypothetical protein